MSTESPPPPPPPTRPLASFPIRPFKEPDYADVEVADLEQYLQELRENAERIKLSEAQTRRHMDVVRTAASRVPPGT